jgi:FkbM family methyltransferase
LKDAPFVAISQGVKLYIEPRAGESFTFFENLIRQDYLRNGITLLTGDTVIDIGANIGTFAVLARSVVGPTGRVIAIEPTRKAFAKLEKNVLMNDFGNIVCVQVAIEDKPGKIALKVQPKSAFSSAYGVNGGEGDVEIVPCLTLSQIFEEYQIEQAHLLKIDCEGSEYGIFESLSPELAARIHQISMEVHPVKKRTADSIRRNLEGLGFEVRPGYPWVAFNKAVRARNRQD